MPDKKIRLKRLLREDREDIAAILRETASLVSFRGELSLYDAEGHLISSSCAEPAQKIDVEKISAQQFQGEYYEDAAGMIFPLFYQTVLGALFVRKGEGDREKILIVSRLIRDVLIKIITLKIEKKHLLQETLNNYREINLLYKFGGTLSSHSNFNSMLTSVLLESKNIIKADTYAIHLLDRETGELRVIAFLGSRCPSSDHSHPDTRVAGSVAATGRSGIVNDVIQHYNIERCDCNINSVVGVPLKVKEELYGVIVLTSQHENHFKARDEKLLLSLATQAAIAIANIYLEKSNWEHKRQLALRRVIKEDDEKDYNDFISGSRPLTRIMDKIPDDPGPYLLYGEYGVGKNLLARVVHHNGKRKKKPFIPVDCSRLSSDESGYKQLFGFEHFYDPKKSETDFSYLELAAGGTLFLRNIDRLPRELGEKLGGFLVPSGDSEVKLSNLDIRIAAETSFSLEEKVEKGEFDPRLYKILKEHTISVAPLRERKKDIIRLAEYFIREHSAASGKHIQGLDDKAHEKLLGYNYRLGNVKELREIIERACVLTESDTITSEFLFIGVPPRSSTFSYNLFNIKPVYALVRKGLFPRPLVYISSLFVFGIFYFGFFSETRFGANPGTFLAWGLWWPFFIFSFFFFSRLWCSFCPINEFGIVLRKIKHFDRKVPPFIKNNTHYFITFGFLSIIWAEETFLLRFSGFRTGIIMAVIFSFAAVVNILYPRHSYCRYICPLGGVGGTLALTSIVELRSNPDICANKCKTHDCFKGNEKIDGCPMSLHTQFVTDNMLCKLCLRCVRLCPNNSPQLNLRLPGWDIVANTHLGKTTSLIILTLLSVPFTIALFESKKFSSAHTALNFNLLYWTLPVIAGIIIWSTNYIYYGSDKKTNFRNFFDILTFYIPLALAANVALQLKYVPLISKTNLVGAYPEIFIQNGLFSFSLVHLLQMGVLAAGLLFSVYIMIGHVYNVEDKEKILFFNYVNHFILMVLYCLPFGFFLIH